MNYNILQRKKCIFFCNTNIYQAKQYNPLTNILRFLSIEYCNRSMMLSSTKISVQFVSQWLGQQSGFHVNWTTRHSLSAEECSVQNWYNSGVHVTCIEMALLASVLSAPEGSYNRSWPASGTLCSFTDPPKIWSHFPPPTFPSPVYDGSSYISLTRVWK